MAFIMTLWIGNGADLTVNGNEMNYLFSKFF